MPRGRPQLHHDCDTGPEDAAKTARMTRCMRSPPKSACDVRIFARDLFVGHVAGEARMESDKGSENPPVAGSGDGADVDRATKTPAERKRVTIGAGLIAAMVLSAAAFIYFERSATETTSTPTSVQQTASTPAQQIAPGLGSEARAEGRRCGVSGADRGEASGAIDCCRPGQGTASPRGDEHAGATCPDGVEHAVATCAKHTRGECGPGSPAGKPGASTFGGQRAGAECSGAARGLVA
jgi:hypothetical protein